MPEEQNTLIFEPVNPETITCRPKKIIKNKKKKVRNKNTESDVNDCDHNDS